MCVGGDRKVERVNLCLRKTRKKFDLKNSEENMSESPKLPRDNSAREFVEIPVPEKPDSGNERQVVNSDLTFIGREIQSKRISCNCIPLSPSDGTNASQANQIQL